MQIAVAKPFDRLVMLGSPGREKDTGVFLGDDKLLLQIDFHRCFQQKEQVIPASGRAADRVIILVKTIVFAKMKGDHKQSPGKWHRRKSRIISFPEDSTEPEEKSNKSEEKNWRFLSAEIMIKIQK